MNGEDFATRLEPAIARSAVLARGVEQKLPMTTEALTQALVVVCVLPLSWP
jgi:hypothetical protein